MNYLRRFLISLLGLTLLLQLAFVTPASAQSAKQLERERFNRVMNPATDIEEFRQELNDYLSEMEYGMQLFSEITVVREKLTKNGLKPLETIAQVKLSIANATPKDLSIMRTTYAKFPGWRDTPRGINALINPKFRQQLEVRLANKESGGSVVNAVPDNCADGLNAGTTNTDIAIAKAFDIAANAVMEALPTDFISILAREAAVAAVAITQAVVLTLETLKGIKDDCTDDTFQAAIQNQVTTSTNTIISNDNTNTTNILANLEAAKTTIVNNDNANTTTIVNNDNANTLALTNLINNALTTIINNANANKVELKNLILRTQIEADLASTDGSTFVALYETASTTCTVSFATPVTQCGYLDLVRIIVSETIANVGSGTNAQSFLTTGDAERAAGQFKAAYASYRRAYKAASK